MRNTMLQKSLIALGLVLAFNVGCDVKVKADNKDEDPTPQDVPYSEELIEGRIDGQAWVMKSGKAKPVFNDASRISITLSERESADPCNDFGMGNKEVLASVKKQVAETKLGTGNPMSSATFLVIDENGSHNMITMNGKIKILEITEDKVIGQAYIYMDGDHEVNGTFEIPLCAGT